MAAIQLPVKYAFLAGGITLGSMAVGWWYYSWNKNHWEASDFDSPDQPGSGSHMHPAFLKKLAKARRIARLPFIINSGFRSVAHNRHVGGVDNSAHLSGVAADIATPFEWMRDRIVWAAKEAGFTRIGIGKNFVHLDMDGSKPQYIAWGYPKGTPPPYNPFLQ